jgi:hypothetical protein
MSHINDNIQMKTNFQKDNKVMQKSMFMMNDIKVKDDRALIQY